MCVDRSNQIDLFLVVATTAALVLVVSLTFSSGEPQSRSLPEREGIGTLASETNEVRRRFAEELVWEEISVGATLHAQDAVYVARDSAATIALDHGGQLTIDERSLVVLGSPQQPAYPDLRIVRGGASGKTRDRELAIAVGGATIQVEPSSRVNLYLTEGDRAEITVAEGQARLLDAQKTIELGAGQRQAIDARGIATGETRAIDVELVAPADTEKIYAAETADVWFVWAERGDWLLELSPERSFTAPQAQIRTKNNRAEITGIIPGVYFWRVRSAPGAEPQRLSEERSLIIVRDHPPEPYRPAPNEIIDLSVTSNLDLAWLALDGVREYEIILLEGGAGGVERLRQQVPRPFISIPADRFVAEAEHCFRVRDADRAQSPWSAPRCFRIVLRPVLPPPVLFEPQLEKKKEQGSLWYWLVGSVAYAQTELDPVTLEWSTIPGAKAYIIEISSERDFRQLLVNQEVSYAHYKFTPPATRDFFWRVRAVDQHGRPGRYSAVRSLTLTIPRPVLLSPATHHRVPFLSRPPHIRLQWQAPAELVTFELEVSQDPEFKSIVVRRTVAGQETQFSPTETGTYYWRVTALGPHGGRGEASLSHAVVVYAGAPKSLLPADQTEIIVTAKTQVTFSWSGRQVASYELALAHDAAFSRDVTLHRVTATSFSTHLASAGVLFWRVRGMGPTTPWSASRQILLRPGLPIPQAPVADWCTELPEDQDTAPVVFAWTPAPGAESYELEVAPVAASAIRERLTTAQHELRLLPGTYTWRLRAFGRGDIASSPTPARRLFIEVPAQKELAGPSPAPRPPEKKSDGRDSDPNPGDRPAPEPDTTRVPTDTLHLAPQVAIYTNFDGVLSPRFALGVGYRLPILVGLVRVTFAVGYSIAANSVVDGDIAVDAELHAFPLAAGLLVEVPAAWLDGFDFFRVVAGLLASVTIAHTVVEVAEQTPQAVTNIMGGGTLSAALEKTLGFGDLFVEIAVTLSSHSSGIVVLDPGGLTFAAGYRFFIF